MKHLLKSSVGSVLIVLASASFAQEPVPATIQYAKGGTLSGKLEAIEPAGIWMLSADGRVWVAAKDLSMTDRVRFGYGTPEERAQVAEAKANAAQKASEEALAALERQRQYAVYAAKMEAREAAHRKAALEAKELALREREVRAAERAANELRQFRLQMQLDAMERSGRQGVVVDYGPRQ